MLKPRKMHDQRTNSTNVKLFNPLSFILCMFILTACSSQNVLTEQEIKTQNEADSAVAELLFEKELDITASYNVRKSGFVVIRFDKSVSEKVYTEVVRTLRSNSRISGVRAEQEGVEVCSLR